jgi:type I restriction enzyme S subunit
MPSDRKILRFGDIVDFVSDKTGTEEAKLATYISTENMEPNFGGVKNAKSMPERGSVNKFKVDDILFSNIRTYFKKVWYAKFDGYCSNDVLVFRTKDKRVLLPSYLHNLCRWEQFTEFSIRTSKGAKMPRGDKDALIQFEFYLPPLKEQQLIAEFLNNLDDRIALLRQTNQTLEQMAHAFFRSWFINYEPVNTKQKGKTCEGIDYETALLFPDDFVDSELGKIPKGWGISELKDICLVTKGCSYKGEGLSDEEGDLMYNLGCFSDNEIYAFNKVKKYTGEYKERHEVIEGDIILANTDITQNRTMLGKPLIIPFTDKKAFISHHLFKLNLKDVLYKNYLFFALKDSLFRNRVSGYAIGTTVLALPKDAFEKFKVVLPNVELLKKYNNITSPLLKKIELNSHYEKTLSDLRNSLLPILVSGKLEISNIKAAA